MKRNRTLDLAALLIVLTSILTGCATQDNAVKPSGVFPNKKISPVHFPTPGISLNPSQTWVEIRKAQANIAYSNELEETTTPSDSLRVTIGRIHILYNIAVAALSEADLIDREKAKNALTEAIDLISALSDREELETDTDFWTLALYILQTYDTHIQPLAELDSDNPALAVHERLFGATGSIVIDENLFLGISLPKTQIPLELNPQVKRFTTYFSKQLHEIFQKYLKRAEVYFPMMEQIIAEEGMPPEIIYLSLVESGVNPRAHSRANATGIWQFIKSTGRLYDLQGNAWFDERQDIDRATRSSMRHLKDLYKQYGDWYLALAAYNAGPGKVNWALRRSQDKSFWGIAPLLRRETREYVPRFIAASLVAMYPEHFGFEPMNFKPAQKPDVVTVSDCISLATIATYSGISLDTLTFLNPELKKEITPPGYKNYTLKVPAGTGETAAAAIALIPESEKLYFLVHKASQKQALIHIAKKYNVQPSSIKQVNGLASATIPKGKVLFIPTSAEFASQNVYSRKELSDDSRERIKKSRVKSRGKHRKRSFRKQRRKAVSSAQAYRESSSPVKGSTQ